MFRNIGPNHSGYNRIRILLAVLLLTAAGLKGHQLATSPVLGSGFLDSRWLLIATVEFELFFGLWLLSGLLLRLTWTAAVGCFGLFAAVSLYKAVIGEASCGCFGPFEVNPWYTFTLDVTAVLTLLRWQPSGMTSSTLIPTRAFMLRTTVVTLTWVGFFCIPLDLRLSVVIPVYNEAVTIEEAIRRIRALEIAKEIIIVDDCSTDGTDKLLGRYADEEDITVLRHDTNQGKVNW